MILAARLARRELPRFEINEPWPVNYSATGSALRVFAFEPIRERFPECGNCDDRGNQEKRNDHLNDVEIYGIASDEPARNDCGKKHDWAKKQVHHFGGSGSVLFGEDSSSALQSR
jgi:hypothetical protein